MAASSESADARPPSATCKVFAAAASGPGPATRKARCTPQRVERLADAFSEGAVEQDPGGAALVSEPIHQTGAFPASVLPGAFESASSSSMASRIANFCTLPVAVWGKAATKRT